MRVKIAGMTRLLTKNCKVMESTTIGIESHHRKSGKIIVNSRQLENQIGKKVRVVIYVRRKR